MKYSRIAMFLVFVCLFSMALAASGFADGAAWDERYGQGEVTGDYMGTWTVANCESYVSLRAWPDRQSDRVTKVPKWADVEAYYYDTEWFECYYNGLHGYILRQYLTDRPGKYSDYPGRQAQISDEYDLSNFGYRPVETRGRGALVFQTSPGGSFLSDYKYRDGDSVYVNLNWRKNGYALAYEDGVYGYVDASYINWGGSSSGSSSSDPKDLSNYAYRRVVTKGRGALVFQKAPGGSFLKNYKYYDGDTIYVNVKWRKNGYTMAYDYGVYGYVDASYIDW